MGSGSEIDKPVLQPHEQEEPEFQKESHKMGFDLNTQIGQIILELKQLKSLEILQSSLNIIFNNKFMLLMVLFSIPFFIFMVFFEIKLQQVVYFYSSKFLANPSSYQYYSKVLDVYDDDDGSNQSSAILRLLLELCSFYLVVYPLIELLSSSAVIKIAGKVHAREKESTLMEIIDEVVPLPSTLKGSLSTYFWVHLLSTSTLVGLFWIVANHFIISARFFAYNYYSYYYYMGTTELYMNAISIGVHSMVFVAILYKYLDWSALWNMGIVISVLEDERGVDALEMSGYYGKRSRGTGFELMLGFFVFGAFLRLSCLHVVGKYRVLVTAIVVGLVCLGNLVKWVALVVYFYDCKAQTLQKKVDEEVGKSGKGHDAC